MHRTYVFVVGVLPLLAPPAAVAQTQTPAAATQTQAPASAAQTATPAAVAQTQTRAAATQTQAPASAAQTQMPAAVAQTQTPASAAQTATPAAVAKTQTPNLNGTVQAPNEPFVLPGQIIPPGGSQPPPAVASIGNLPVRVWAPVPPPYDVSADRNGAANPIAIAPDWWPPPTMSE